MDLCAGIGGFSLTGKWLIGDWRTVCYVEIDEYCQKVIRQRIKDGYLDDAPIWDDLRAFDGRPWRGAVDIITAGFPCQPFSSAARGHHVAENLWPEIARVIKECKPSTVFLENVKNSRKYFLSMVRKELSGFGYSLSILGNIHASYVGAPHKRTRIWMVANSDNKSKSTSRFNDETSGVSFNEGTWCQEDFWRIIRMDDGDAYRLDRIRALGNAIVPEVARTAWEILTLQDGD